MVMSNLEIRDDNCFCCGKDNRQGLHLEYTYPTEGKSRTTCKIPEYFSGWSNITHGGFLSMLLDETMAHACRGKAEMAVTAEMTVRYKKPVRTGDEVILEGEVVSTRSKIVETRARVILPNGDTAAEGQARFILQSNS